MRLLLSAFILAIAATGQPARLQAAERAQVDVACVPTAKPLDYDCTLTLSTRDGKQPIAGAEVTVKADMPTMAMAHNLKPVTAAPLQKVGDYKVLLTLDMHGEWLLSIDIARPFRDRVLVKRVFRPGASEAVRN